MNLNRCTLVGRMTKDVELKKLESGSSVAHFSIATNENWTDKKGEKVQKTEFHNIVVWNQQAENCAKYLRKGQLVMIEGKITTQTWEKEDGSKAYKTEINAQNVQFGPKAQNAQGEAETSEDVIDHDTGEKVGTTNKVNRINGAPAVIPTGQKRLSDDQIDYPADQIDPDSIPF